MKHRPEIPQSIIDLYDEYTHVSLDRRAFLDRLTAVVGSAAGATAFLAMIEADRAHAAIVAADDARLTMERVKFPGSSGELAGYLAQPKDATGKLPAVMIIHENRGLNPHIEDVTRRMALEGFVALAPDFLAPAGGTPTDEDKARELIGVLDPAKTTADAVAAANYLRELPQANGKVGAVGFCWGGGVINQLAVTDPQLSAAVAYYGRQADAADVPKVKAALLLHYAGLDERINAGIPAFETALKAAGTQYELFIYEGANHAFNNDTSEARYNKAAADLAWSRSVEFLKRHLAA